MTKKFMLSHFDRKRPQNYTPKSVKFSDIFKFSASKANIPPTVMSQARDILKSQGYSDTKIRQIITDDTQIPISDMKQVADLMNKNKIYGFTQDANILMKNYVAKQRIKAQNIARIIHEHNTEAMEEDLSKGSAGTSLNTLGKGSASSLNNRGTKPDAPGASSSGTPPRINLPF